MLLCQNSAPVDRRLIPCVAYERADFGWVYVRAQAIRLAIASNYSAHSQKFFGPAWNKAAHCEVCAPCWAFAAGHASERSVAAPDRGKREAKRRVCLSYSRKLGASEVWLAITCPLRKPASDLQLFVVPFAFTPSSSRRPLEHQGARASSRWWSRYCRARGSTGPRAGWLAKPCPNLAFSTLACRSANLMRTLPFLNFCFPGVFLL